MSRSCFTLGPEDGSFPIVVLKSCQDDSKISLPDDPSILKIGVVDHCWG